MFELTLPLCQRCVSTEKWKEALTDPQNKELWEYSAPTEISGRGCNKNDHGSSFDRSHRFPRRLCCHHVDQADGKASSRRNRPRPPCTSKPKHQGNEENQVLEDRGEIAEEATESFLGSAQGARNLHDGRGQSLNIEFRDSWTPTNCRARAAAPVAWELR